MRVGHSGIMKHRARIITICVVVALCLYLYRISSCCFNGEFALNTGRRDIHVHQDKDMDLYLRMTSSKHLVKFYDKVLVQSMYYFWPDNFSMVVVLDNENHRDHQFGNIIQNTFPSPRICYMDPINIRGYDGRDRMQRDMFYPELCTSKKYVAYIDTDTMFVSRVVPEMLFVHGKPKVVASYGYIVHTWWQHASEDTFNLFKTKEVMRCMSYFPVIMKVEHIVELRKYLEKLHGMPFDELLVTIAQDTMRYFGQFNEFCQYVWMFHRDEYVFYLQYQPDDKPLISSITREDETYFTKLSIHQGHPIARFSLHYKYILEDWRCQGVYRHIFRASICFMGGFELCPNLCMLYSKTSLRKEMFVFDTIDWTWDNRCMEAQRRHYRELATYDSDTYTDIIKQACAEVDSLVWDW